VVCSGNMQQTAIGIRRSNTSKLGYSMSSPDGQRFTGIYPGRFQCFDTVGWVSGTACDVQKLCDEMLAWLSVWSKVQRIAYGPADSTATPSSLALLKSRLVWPFLCRLTQVVLEKRLINRCVCLSDQSSRPTQPPSSIFIRMGNEYSPKWGHIATAHKHDIMHKNRGLSHGQW